MNGRSRAVVWLCALGAAIVVVSCVLVPYSMLRNATGIFQASLKNGGYPAATVTQARVATVGSSSSKGYDARIKVGGDCLLHLRMRQPGLFGGGFSLVEVNGEPLQLDGSPTYDQALAYAVEHGYKRCRK